MLHTRLLLISGLFLGLMFAGIATLSGEALILAVPFGIYLILSFYMGPGGIKLEAKRYLSADRVPLGGEVDVMLEVSNVGPPIKSLRVEEILPDGIRVVEGESNVITSLLHGESVSLTYTIMAGRGAYRFPGVRVQTSDTFDMFRKREVLLVINRLLVLPRVNKLRRMELRPRQTRIFSGQIPARIGGPGVEFHGVRPYQPGDPTRWINTRLLAKDPDALYINEFEQERVADIGLILDARMLSNMPSDEISLLEHSVEAAATLSDYLLDAGNRVGLLIYGGPINWTFPGYGRVQKERILQALAHAEHGANPIFEDLSYIPTRLFPIRTQLILFSPVLDEDLPFLTRLRARGYQIILVSPDPIAIELNAHPHPSEIDLAAKLARLERDLTLRRLQQTGVQIVDWDVSKSFHSIADQILSRSPGIQQRNRLGARP